MRFYSRISLIERRWGLERFRQSSERPPAGRHLIGMPPRPTGLEPYSFRLRSREAVNIDYFHSGQFDLSDTTWWARLP
jgi:hypothetical protein